MSQEHGQSSATDSAFGRFVKQAIDQPSEIGIWMKVAHQVIVVTFPFVTAGLGWVLNATITNDKQIAVLQSDFRAEKESRVKMTDQVADLQKMLHSLDKKVPDNLMQRLDALVEMRK